MAELDGFMGDVVRQLRDAPAKTTQNELPSYTYTDTEQLKSLLHGSSTLQAFYVGTGASIFTSALLPAMLKARHEIILVTCFWAKSKSLDDLNIVLRRIIQDRQNHQSESEERLRIRICFSSRTLRQKLTHTTDIKGYTYPPSTWKSLLGLPSAEDFENGRIDLVVKSLFFLPFSVMHPKFLIVDREHTFLPSCNISWEPWLEDCVHVKGDATQRVLQFYSTTWGDDLPSIPRSDGAVEQADGADGPEVSGEMDRNGPGSTCVRFKNSNSLPDIPTATLPSSHHRDPNFRPFFWQSCAPMPKTPLNLTTIQLLGLAQSQIYIQTPNITAEPVLEALIEALARGVNVKIVTGENMMKYEQIVTAFTTTASCIRSLIRRHETSRGNAFRINIPYGSLDISYFKPLRPQLGRKAGDEEQALTPKVNEYGLEIDTDEPVQSHIKLTMVDETWTVLGSGNMDRASFYTSQELGVLFHSPDFARSVQESVQKVLDGRLKTVYPTGV